MIKVSIYGDDDKKYFTRLRIKRDKTKPVIIRLLLSLEEYTGMINGLIHDIVQINDGTYHILNYGNFTKYLQRNIYKLGASDVDMSVGDFLDLMTEEQKNTILNGVSGGGKICFISTPLILEKIRFIFGLLHKKVPIMTYLKLQKTKGNAISLIDMDEVLPCLTTDNMEKIEMYDIDIFLREGRCVTRKDIRVVPISDFGININLYTTQYGSH